MKVGTKAQGVGTWAVGTWAVVAMFVVTGLYLCVEVPFSAYLLDALGGEATSADLGVAERAGRVVSGLAVAVALCGCVLPAVSRRGWSPSVSVAIPLALAALTVAAVYRGERGVVETVVERSSTDLRARCLRAGYARAALLREPTGLSGLPAGAGAAGDPAWMAFRGLFGFLAQADEGIMERLPSGGRTVVERSVRDAFPSREALRTDVMDAAMRPVRAGYAALLGTEEARAGARAQVDARAERAWRDYRAGPYVWAGGGRPGPVWAATREPILAALRARGLEMPRGWDVEDRATFLAVAREKGYAQVATRHAEAARALLGEDAGSADAVTDLRGYAALGGVQARIRRAIGLGHVPDAVVPDMSDQAFERSVYLPLLTDRIAAETGAVATGRGLEDGGALAGEGRDAVRAAVVPFVALGLSLVGMVVHAFKFANYGLALVGRGFPEGALGAIGASRFARGATAAALAASLGVGVHRTAPDVVATTFYRVASASLTRDLGRPTSLAARMIVEMEGGAYPLGGAMAALVPFRAFRAAAIGPGPSGPSPTAAIRLRS